MKLFDVYPINDINIVRAKDSYVWDENGVQYLDMYGGHARDHDVEDHVETNLVVPSSGTSMRHGICTKLFRVFGNVQGLAETFCAHA